MHAQVQLDDIVIGHRASGIGQDSFMAYMCLRCSTTLFGLVRKVYNLLVHRWMRRGKSTVNHAT